MNDSTKRTYKILGRIVKVMIYGVALPLFFLAFGWVLPSYFSYKRLKDKSFGGAVLIAILLFVVSIILWALLIKVLSEWVSGWSENTWLVLKIVGGVYIGIVACLGLVIQWIEINEEDFQELD